MACDTYNSFALERISAEAFAVHCDSCSECREAYTLDTLIEDEVRYLPVPEPAPNLWSRIATDLEGERRPALLRFKTRLTHFRHQPIFALSALVAAVVTIFVLLQQVPPEAGMPPDKLLTIQALSKVEILEQQYEQAITELELLANPLIAEADTRNALRYRRLLESIDAQIERCQNALAGDTANAHKRRYLLAAYHEKKETLSALLLRDNS